MKKLLILITCVGALSAQAGLFGCKKYVKGFVKGSMAQELGTEALDIELKIDHIDKRVTPKNEYYNAKFTDIVNYGLC